MLSWYNFIDIILILIIIFFTYQSYKNKSYLIIFEYFKIFIIITLAAKLAPTIAVLLQKFHITKADTYTTLILIAFGFNFIVFYSLWKQIFKLSNNYINNNQIKNILAKIFTLFEVVILTTFSLYIFMQFYPPKVYLSDILHKTYSYKYIEKFYHNFLNDNFVNMILQSDTGTNKTEVIFKSFKNSI